MSVVAGHLNGTGELLDPFAWAGKGKRLKPLSASIQDVRKGIVTAAQRVQSVIAPKQAVLKVTSFRAGVQGANQVINYVSRDGDLELHRSNGQVIKGKEQQEKLVQSWEPDFSGRKNGRDVMHMVVSTPIGTNRADAAKAGRAFAQEAFGHNWDYVVVAHNDEKHPHSHIIVKMVGMDGERLKTNKADLRQWRYQFAEACQDRGINVSASPRYVRGQVRRSTPSKLWHSHRHGVSRVVVNAVEDAIGFIRDPASARIARASMPWVEKIADRCSVEKEAFKTLAASYLKQVNQSRLQGNVPHSQIHAQANIQAALSARANHIGTSQTQRAMLVHNGTALKNQGHSAAATAQIMQQNMTQMHSPQRQAALHTINANAQAKAAAAAQHVSPGISP